MVRSRAALVIDVRYDKLIRRSALAERRGFLFNIPISRRGIVVAFDAGATMQTVGALAARPNRLLPLRAPHLRRKLGAALRRRLQAAARRTDALSDRRFPGRSSGGLA